MSIAQEHTLSALTKFFIGKRISQHYRKDNAKKIKFLLATPTGEMHSIGLLLSALLMVEHHVDFIYLGEDLSAESIAEAALATDSDYILLSVSPAFNRNYDINDFGSRVKNHVGNRCSLWVGGAIEQLNSSTIRDAQITTIDGLETFNTKLARLVDSVV
jgi:methylmalonyl-CoA mutase cobalamin-binding subunit